MIDFLSYIKLNKEFGTPVVYKSIMGKTLNFTNKKPISIISTLTLILKMMASTSI